MLFLWLFVVYNVVLSLKVIDFKEIKDNVLKIEAVFHDPITPLCLLYIDDDDGDQSYHSS